MHFIYTDQLISIRSIGNMQPPAILVKMQRHREYDSQGPPQVEDLFPVFIQQMLFEPFPKQNKTK